jgi:hypothetical protein
MCLHGLGNTKTNYSGVLFGRVYRLHPGQAERFGLHAYTRTVLNTYTNANNWDIKTSVRGQDD